MPGGFEFNTLVAEKISRFWVIERPKYNFAENSVRERACLLISNEFMLRRPKTRLVA